VSVLPPAWGTLYLLSRLDDPTICASPIRYLSRCARGIWGLSGESGDYRGLVTNSVRERVLLRSRGVAQPDRAPVVCCKVLVSTIETLRAGRLRVQVPPPHPIVENKRSPPRPSTSARLPVAIGGIRPMWSAANNRMILCRRFADDPRGRPMKPVGEPYAGNPHVRFGPAVM
jgi:hypothetical protein